MSVSEIKEFVTESPQIQIQIDPSFTVNIVFMDKILNENPTDVTGQLTRILIKLFC